MQQPTRSVQVQEALDESRTLILGAQIMLGLLYRAAFEPGYDRLPAMSQYLVVSALALIIIAFVVLVSPVPYHWIVDRGQDAAHLLDFINHIIHPVLPILGAAMGLTIFVAAEKIWGSRSGLWIATFASSIGMVAWLGGSRAARPTRKKPSPAEKTDLEDRIKHVLTEARMVLPGAQALLGFQFVTMLMDDFDRLPQSSKVIHLVSLLLTSLSVTLLMTPAARHRIVERGANTEQFHRFASRILLASMVPLALAIAGDFYMVAAKVTSSQPLAIAGVAFTLLLAFGLWFGYTLYLRHKSGRAL